MKRKTIASVVLSVLCLAHLSAADIWHVDPDGDDFAPGSAGSPFATIGHALSVAQPGDTVSLATGVHELDATAVLDSGIALVGETGDPADVFVQPAEGAGIVLLDITNALAAVRGITFRNAVFTNGTDGAAIRLYEGVLEGCAVRDGFLKDPPDGAGGVAIRQWGGIVTNCVVSGNAVVSTNGVNGGAVRIEGGLFTSSDVHGNRIESTSFCRGAGIAMMGAGEIASCSITGNHQKNTAWNHVYGTGVYMADGTLRDSSVCANSIPGSNRTNAGICGGNLCMDGGFATNCLLNAHVGVGHYTYGGGIALYNTAHAVDCTIATNSLSAGHVNRAGGAYLGSGAPILERCRIFANTISSGSEWGAAGLAIEDNGTVRNCLIYANHSNVASPASGVFLAKGLLEGCTVVGNSSAVSPGVYLGGGTVRNCISFANSGSDSQIAKAGGVVQNCCASPLVGGGSDTGNIAVNPSFMDAPAGDYRLRPGSPCIDTGLAMDSVDLAGVRRPVDGDGDGAAASDMGCFEFVAPQDGPPCFTVAVANGIGLESLDAAFSATPAGNLEGLVCYWDFGDGTTASGAFLTNTTHYYSTIGVFDVTLCMTNAADEGGSDVQPGLVRVIADADAYVSADGSDEFPYSTLETAAHDVADAVDAIATILAVGGTSRTVWIDDGIHLLARDVRMDSPMTLQGLNPGAGAILDGQRSRRCAAFVPGADGSILRNLTLRNGLASKEAGGALHITASNCVVEACVVANNQSGTYGGGIYSTGANNRIRDTLIHSNQSGADGGGLYLGAGTAVDCVVSNNYCHSHHAHGGGIAIAGGAAVSRCVIVRNRIRCGHTAGGSGANAISGTLRNCLVAGNNEENCNTPLAGAVRLTAGVVESCTIAANRSYNTSGLGLTLDGNGTVATDCIVQGNIPARVEAVNEAAIRTGNGIIRYSCYAPLVEGANNVGNVTNAPGFRDPAGGDYRLRNDSPIRMKGLVLDWMEGATDLAGQPRLVGGRVDMGCYQGLDAGTLLLVR